MSVMRGCEIYRANNGKWYLALNERENDFNPDNAIHYGPFNSEDEADEELNNHANPGGLMVDDSGKKEAPKNPQRPRPFGLPRFI